MIVAKAPFRISFVGGGTDFEDYYRLGWGNVVSTTIDKYMHVTLIRKFDGRIHLRYSEFECVDSVNEVRHRLIREALRHFGIKRGVEMATISDIPARGSGLGSSSSLLVALVQALSLFERGETLAAEELAEKACEIEIKFLQEPIGRQDQYAAAYTGFNKITFRTDAIEVVPIERNERLEWLEQATKLYFLGVGRNAGDILCNHKKGILERKGVLDKQRDLVPEFMRWLGGYDKESYAGDLVNLSWRYKKDMTPGATNERIDKLIRDAIKAGAYGAKVCGAGSGGFLMVICEPEKQEAVDVALRELQGMKMRFGDGGVKVADI